MGYVSLEIDQLDGRSWGVCVKFGFMLYYYLLQMG
jgi:hypothetical protein